MLTITDVINLLNGRVSEIPLGDWGISSPDSKFMGTAWGPPEFGWPQMGPMLAPWTLLSGIYPDVFVW